MLVQGGNLYVGNGGTSTGDFSVGGGTHLTFGGTHILSGEIVGEGLVTFYGGEALVAGRYDVTEGTVRGTGHGGIYLCRHDRMGNDVHVAGKAKFRDTSISTDELYVSGELSVSSGDGCRSTERLQWQGGTMSGAGETIVGT